MTAKQAPIGQIQGRGQRVKLTEGYFNMKCLDDCAAALEDPAPVSAGDGMSLDDYAKQFDGVQGGTSR